MCLLLLRYYDDGRTDARMVLIVIVREDFFGFMICFRQLLGCCALRASWFIHSCPITTNHDTTFSFIRQKCYPQCPMTEESFIEESLIATLITCSSLLTPHSWYSQRQNNKFIFPSLLARNRRFFLPPTYGQ